MSGSISFNMNSSKKGPKLAFGLKSQQKAPVATTAFTPDSDEDDKEQRQDNKRQRRAFSDAPGPSLPTPSTSLEPDVQKTAEKLAEFVAKNGRSFEDITRQRNPQGGPFMFLFDTSSPGYKFYEAKLEEFSRKQQPGFLAATPIPVAPQQTTARQTEAKSSARLPPAGRPLVPELSTGTPLESSKPVTSLPPMVASSPGARLAAMDWSPDQPQDWSPNAVAGRLGSLPPSSSRREPTAGDSLAAMEAFTKMAAKRDEEREEQEARLPLLKETSFDRRRTVAVYKEDGSRGHHMQDYIPQQELAKFLAKGGSKEAQAQADAIEAASRIQSDNIGHKLLSKMGWKEGQGLGAAGSGAAAPVTANAGVGSERRGLGADDPSAPQEGDDQFEAYRKRMMLGYKYRPNPLGNPRKAYY